MRFWGHHPMPSMKPESGETNRKTEQKTHKKMTVNNLINLYKHPIIQIALQRFHFFPFFLENGNICPKY